jgi:hypothetical protein
MQLRRVADEQAIGSRSHLAQIVWVRGRSGIHVNDLKQDSSPSMAWLRSCRSLGMLLFAAAYHLPMMPPARRTMRARLQASEPPGYPDEVELASMVAEWKRHDSRSLAVQNARLASGTANRSRAGASLQRRPARTIALRGSAGAGGEPPSRPSKRLQFAREQVIGVVAAGMSTKLPAVQYDPVRAAARFSARPLEVSRRQVALVSPLVRSVRTLEIGQWLAPLYLCTALTFPRSEAWDQRTGSRPMRSTNLFLPPAPLAPPVSSAEWCYGNRVLCVAPTYS